MLCYNETMTMQQIHAPLPIKSLLDTLSLYSAEEVDQIFAHTARIKIRRYAPSLSQAETELYKKIYSISIPKSLQEQCRKLTNKQRNIKLSADERQQLIQVIDAIEILNAKRLAYLVDLALLQQVDLDELIRQIDLTPLSYE